MILVYVNPRNPNLRIVVDRTAGMDVIGVLVEELKDGRWGMLAGSVLSATDARDLVKRLPPQIAHAEKAEAPKPRGPMW